MNIKVKMNINNEIMKRIFAGFIFIFFIVLLSNVVSAEIATIDKNVVYPGDVIKLTISPTRSGFYNIIYVYKNTQVVDVINVPCATICKQRKTVSYTVPANFLGEYYFATFDYAINNYELDYFNVIEQGGASQGTLTVVDIKNTNAGISWIINPEQGKNANIIIDVQLVVKNCQNYNVYAYLCDSLISVCGAEAYTHKIPLILISQVRTTCNFRYTGEGYFPFYQKADNWKILAKSGAVSNEKNFVYTSLAAIRYASLIDFGTINANMWNVGVPEQGIELINYGNVEMMVDWNSAGFSCVSPECTDFWPTYFNGENLFQIDDDNLFMEEVETGLTPVFITDFSLNYFPQNKLLTCISSSCNNNIGERVKTFFNLKVPSVQRGIYEGDIRVTLY